MRTFFNSKPPASTMKYDFVKIRKIDTTLRTTYHVILKGTPSRAERWMGKEEQEFHYQGSTQGWFELPELKPCKPAMEKMLNQYLPTPK
jgi:hypothetical protein